MGRLHSLASAFLLAAALLPSIAGAQSFDAAQEPAGDLGIGGQIGEPSGVTFKIYQRPTLAYEFLAAWDLDRFFYLNAHALYERPIPDSPLRYYFGPGIVLGVTDDSGSTDLVVGLSGQAGVNFFVERFEVFLHLTPRLDIIPSTDGEVGGGIGLRYYL